MPKAVMPPAAQRLRSATILIVEDDAEVGNFLQQLIEEETPYHTSVVADGMSALEQVAHLYPCLFLLDYKLPGINGIELYDRLQQVEQARGVPTIMMSVALPVEELARRGIYQLRKPMDIGSVIRMITHAIASFQEQQQYA